MMLEVVNFIDYRQGVGEFKKNQIKSADFKREISFIMTPKGYNGATIGGKNYYYISIPDGVNNYFKEHPEIRTNPSQKDIVWRADLLSVKTYSGSVYASKWVNFKSKAKGRIEITVDAGDVPETPKPDVPIVPKPQPKPNPGPKPNPKPQPPLGSAAIGVDLNRDGPIDFDKADKTSAAKPFRFWLNTDNDAYVAAEKDQQDVAPGNGQDSADNKITVTRDLEDFARLHVQAPSGFKPDGTWRCTMNFTDATGNPAIRLWEAVKSGTEYLTDPKVAAQQLVATPKNGANNWPVGASIREIPLSLFKAAGGDKYRAEFIFEAMRAGKGAVQVHFYKDGKEQLAQNPVWLDLHPIGDFYDYYQLPSVDRNGVTTDTNKTLALAAISAEQSSDYILFVHGWRMQEWSKKAAAETAYKRLWQRGYKGKFGLFSWPAEYVDLTFGVPLKDPQNFDRSERIAWLSAAALRELLVSLNARSPQKVRVVAHSLGNVVVSEALLSEAESETPRKLVHTYIATQAAVAAQAYDEGVPDVTNIFFGPNVYKSYPLTSRPYFEGTKKGGGLALSTGRLINYFNPNDSALSGWRKNQLTKPDVGWGFKIISVPLQPKGAFHRGNVENGMLFGELLEFPNDRYEIFAHAAPAFSQALGTQVVAGLFSLNVNLGDAPFSLTDKPSDHSAQFNSDLATRYKYWDRLMKDFDINDVPPK